MTSEREQDPRSGLPEDPGHDQEDRSEDQDPHHALNIPVGEPDPTEWPDPYDQREDPRDPVDPDLEFGEAPHTPTGSQSTSAPNPKQDPEAEPWAEAPKRDKLDQ